MYFASRMQAGRMLAQRLSPQYRYENCAVVALGDGGVVVGAQIAAELHCVLTMLMSSEINLPHEPRAIGGITPDGVFTYNPEYPAGELEELVGENRALIEQQKLEQMHAMNQLVGGSGTINRQLLKGNNVIVVSDGLASSFQVELVAQFLKPISIDKLIFAVPLASVQAVDRIHVLADQIVCLDAVPEYRHTSHYYDQQDIPDHDTVVRTIENIVLNWR